MLNVLIPTDFTAASLKQVETAIKNSDKKINIILFHAFYLPDSAFDLLTSSGRNPHVALMNEPFRQACKQLKDAYPQMINKITVNCMQGNTKALFRNFIDANDVDFICCPVSYSFESIHKQSLNPISLFKKAGIPFVKELSKSESYVFDKTTLINTETEQGNMQVAY